MGQAAWNAAQDAYNYHFRAVCRYKHNVKLIHLSQLIWMFVYVLVSTARVHNLKERWHRVAWLFDHRRCLPVCATRR
jgi:DNA-binding FadR family transcriptional regulator